MSWDDFCYGDDSPVVSGEPTPVDTNEDFKKTVESLTEIELYRLIHGLGGFIWRMNHDMAHGHIPEKDCPAVSKDVLNCQEKIEIAVDQVKRFGVEQPRDEKGVGTPNYWKWFHWWDTYVQGMPQKDYDLLCKDEALVADGAPANILEKWRPQGDWKTT